MPSEPSSRSGSPIEGQRWTFDPGASLRRHGQRSGGLSYLPSYEGSLSDGSVLMRASLHMCATCHSDSQIVELEAFHKQLRELVQPLLTELERIRGVLKTAELPADRKAALEKQMVDLDYDVRFLGEGNDIHNSHYASSWYCRCRAGNANRQGTQH